MTIRVRLADLREIIVSEAKRLLEANKRCRCSADNCFHSGYDCHNRAGTSLDAEGASLCDACADTQPSTAAEEQSSSSWQCLDCDEWFPDMKTHQKHLDKHFPPGAKRPVRLKRESIDDLS